MDYKISVITPVYNAEKTLPAAFESVKKQSIGFENIEYILVDDLSGDGSAALLDGYAAQYSNVKVLHRTKNSGTAGAPRNDALDIATAPYVMFLDNDDLLFPRACEALYCAAEQGGADIVSGGFHAFADIRVIGPDPDTEVFRFTGLPEGRYQFGDFCREFTHELCWTLCFSFWTKIYRRELIRKYDIRFSEGIYGEDVAFMHLYVAKCRSAQIIKENIINWRVRDDSLSHTSDSKLLAGAGKSIDYVLERARKIDALDEYCHILDLTETVEYHTEWLLKEKSVTGDDLKSVLAAWQPFYALALERGFHIHTAYTKILAHDLTDGDVKSAAYNAVALRELFFQRKQELDDIFASRTWKLARLMQKVLGRG
ncbi:MAG: glycosyltransferase [Oscillospiraceae bacterium]